MLSSAGPSHEFWEKAVDTACYLVNRPPSLALVDKTSYGAWAGKKPSFAHLRVFGCDAFVYVPKDKRSKCDSKSEKCIFIEYKDGLKGYKIWNSVTRKIVYSRDVIFKEVAYTSRNEDEIRGEETQKKEFKLRNDEFDSQEGFEWIESNEEVEHQTLVLRRFGCVRRQADMYIPPDFHFNFALSTSNEDPRSVKEEVDLLEGKLWKEAMVENM